ncbi:hypothetical protein GIB67_002695 [Kingdonia uniflora]|uniref:UFSP1/2/DUB catalytic domain-containing protein n=1 Tax=Kingdonia uniflora TaxID=39325 RepID=A0A7J7LJI2_9MAGN|nr:hypothetical protein GIB67_002695 [Kingdonia uniflora]
MSTSICPFCNQTVASSYLERHANSHFDDEELARDVDLAHQIALALTSPPRPNACQVDDTKSLECSSEEIPHKKPRKGNGGQCVSENISCLVSLQIRGSYQNVEGGLMTLLRRCLEVDKQYSVSVLACNVDHFQTLESEDIGWGCGWRNIQMLSSHLLMQRTDAKDVMFGGSGFVPDIPFLQRWLEIAWEKGFDTFGSHSFGETMYGSTQWIGTTECATLFRSFGLRARIVDFDSKDSGAKAMETNSKGKRNIEHVYGPMDKFLHNGNSEEHDNSKKCLPRKVMGHQVLMEWVWDYFADKKFNRSDNLRRVIVSEKMPLYFQHNGHSRTIVGIQLKQLHHGLAAQYSLLVLDPGHRTEALEKALKENVGWQRLIKRGLHTLKKPQYQLCYVDPNIAHGEEMERLKIIDSIYFEA